MMNCEDFRNRLYEYLDETLSAEVEAEARKHIEHCSACRYALQREEAATGLLRLSFDRATTHLALRPQLVRDIARGFSAETRPWHGWRQRWQRFVSMPVGVAGASVVLVVVLVLSFATRPRRALERITTPGAVQHETHQACVIEVPIRTQTHVFRRQGGAVVDETVSSAAFAYAKIPEQPQ